MYLFFDTETTGLPKNWRASVTDLNNWPRLVQLAYLVYDKNGTQLSSGEFLIRPEDFKIPKAATRIHGITTEMAFAEGQNLTDVLHEFSNAVRDTDCLVAHNISFDEKIVGAEFLRKGMMNPILGKLKVCTKESTTDFCAIPGPYGYKFPTLSELYYKLFKSKFTEAHNAMNDTIVTAQCFWELKKLGIL